MQDRLDADDATGIRNVAHAIKGAASSVGGETLGALGFEVELAGKDGDLAVVAARLPELREQFDRFKAAAEELVGSVL